MGEQEDERNYRWRMQKVWRGTCAVVVSLSL